MEIANLSQQVHPMALTTWVRGALLAMIVGTASCGSCNEMERIRDADPIAYERLDEPGSDVRASYDSVLRAVKKIEALGRPKGGIISAVPTHRVACQVDENHKVHALRLPRAQEPSGSTRPQIIEYAVLGEDATTEPTWRPLAQIYGAEAPELLLDGPSVVGGVNGALSPQSARSEFYGKSLLVFPITQAAEVRPSVCLKYTVASARLAATPEGRLLAISHKYVRPIDDVSSIGLRVYSCEDGDARAVAEEVPGSLHENSIPEDYALYVSHGEVHIVYEGVRGDPSSKDMRLWHVVLDAKGALVFDKALAHGIQSPYLTRIFAGPDSRLYVLEAHLPSADDSGVSATFGRRILPLDALAEKPGPAASFFVDRWLQVHAVWFDGGNPRYFGPTGQAD